MKWRYKWGKTVKQSTSRRFYILSILHFSWVDYPQSWYFLLAFLPLTVLWRHFPPTPFQSVTIPTWNSEAWSWELKKERREWKQDPSASAGLHGWDYSEAREGTRLKGALTLRVMEGPRRQESGLTGPTMSVLTIMGSLRNLMSTMILSLVQFVSVSVTSYTISGLRGSLKLMHGLSIGPVILGEHLNPPVLDGSLWGCLGGTVCSEQGLHSGLTGTWGIHFAFPL